MAGFKRARSYGRGRKGTYRKRRRFGGKRRVGWKRSVKRSIRKLYRKVRRELKVDGANDLSDAFQSYDIGATAAVGVACAIDIPAQGVENYQVVGRTFNWKEWIFNGSFQEIIDRNDALYRTDGYDLYTRFFVIVDKLNTMSSTSTFARPISLFTAATTTNNDQDSIWLLPPGVAEDSAVITPVRNPSTYNRYEIIYSKLFHIPTNPDLYSPTSVTTANAKRTINRPFQMRVKCPKKFRRCIGDWAGGADSNKNQVIFCVWLFPHQDQTLWVPPPAGGNTMRLNFKAYSKYYDD